LTSATTTPSKGASGRRTEDRGYGSRENLAAQKHARSAREGTVVVSPRASHKGQV